MNDKLKIWELINRPSDAEIRQLRDQFTNAAPFPHLIIDNFFKADVLAAIERDFPVRGEEYDRFCLEDGGQIGTNYANGDLASFPTAFKLIDAIVKDQAFLRYISAVTDIDDLEYDPNYFGGGIRESRSGTFLPPHLDFNYHPTTQSHRRMNLLFYFNQEWREEWGGNLQVHKDPNTFSDNNSLVHSYMPVYNRCLLFETSEISWHGFDRLNLPEGKSRRAFTIYYYTKHRPNENAIKFHNTEYVEPPLPPYFRSGYTLSEADVKLLQEYIARRDGRIRMLYELRAELDAKLRHVWSEYEYYLNLSLTPSLRRAASLARKGIQYLYQKSGDQK
jgi:hypothetical protein